MVRKSYKPEQLLNRLMEEERDCHLQLPRLFSQI